MVSELIAAFGHLKGVAGLGINISEPPYVRVLIILTKECTIWEYDSVCRVKEEVARKFEGFLFEFEEKKVDW